MAVGEDTTSVGRAELSWANFPQSLSFPIYTLIDTFAVVVAVELSSTDTHTQTDAASSD